MFRLLCLLPKVIPSCVEMLKILQSATRAAFGRSIGHSYRGSWRSRKGSVAAGWQCDGRSVPAVPDEDFGGVEEMESKKG